MTVDSFHDDGSGRHSHPAQIPFPFTFFGQLKENVTITTEGFLSLRDLNVPSLSMMKVQKISALGSDFKLQNESDVRYLATPSEFVVEWKDVVLQNSDSDKAFHFQIVLSKNGTVTLNYIQIPDSFHRIADNHKVSEDDLYIAGMSGEYLKPEFICILIVLHTYY